MNKNESELNEHLEVKELNRRINPLNGNILIDVEVKAKSGAKLEFQISENQYIRRNSFSFTIIEKR